MTAVILAAGIASRLRPFTDNTPKSLLSIGGKPLLQRTIESLRHCGISDCVIVTGYLSDKIEQFVGNLNSEMQIDFIFNSLYESTNNNYSLWLTRPIVDATDILLLDADILFDQNIPRLLIDAPFKDALIMRLSDSLGEEEIKLELDTSGTVLTIGKHIDPKLAMGESLGIEKFSAKTTKILFEVMEKRKDQNEFYEASFQEMINTGVKIHAVDCLGYPCMEIDTPEDLSQAHDIASKIL